MVWKLFYTILGSENRLIEVLLRQPAWHRFVGNIQRRVDEMQNGPLPNKPPLRPGEATEDPNHRGFMYYFLDEIRSAFRKPQDNSQPPNRPSNRN